MGITLKPYPLFYQHLFIDTPKVLLSCHNAWLSDFPQLEDILGPAFSKLVSTRDHLIQYKFLHRIYQIPAKLVDIFPTQCSNCWRCAVSGADLMHIFWHCLAIQQFWAEVIRSVTTIRITPSVEVCFYGPDQLAPTKVIHTLLTVLFYYARKVSILSWN